jgi:putative membrane protein
MNLAAWPALNAALNATSALLLLTGFFFIRAKQISRHAAFMVGALGVSALFFLSYLAYHVKVGSVHFLGTGWVRPVYFTILITHTILAVAIVPLALRTLFLAIRKRWPEHVALARWTFPLWLYVSVSGVVVYWMFYQWK